MWVDRDKFFMECEESKKGLRYATLRISSRRYAVIEYESAGRSGDCGGIITHTFRFLEGFRSVPFSVAHAEVVRLERASLEAKRAKL